MIDKETKLIYNHLLTRYNNGVKYLETHINEIDKWLPDLIKIQEQLAEMIRKYNIPDKNILTGF